jgi:hypothetical protein
MVYRGPVLPLRLFLYALRILPYSLLVLFYYLTLLFAISPPFPLKFF